jgi:hypothetical protein
MLRVSWPPRAAVRLAVVLVLLLGVVAAGAGLLGGGVAALGVLFGAVVGLPAAVADVRWRLRAALALLTGLAAWLGAAASGAPLVAGAVVAVTALAQVPFTERGAQLAAMVPVVPALTATVDLPQASWVVGAWMASGGLVMALLAAAWRVRVPPEPTARGEALRHSVATALVAGGGLVVTRALEIGHGYWLVLAVVSVLGVSRDATGREAAERVVGTLAGVALGVLVVAVLPLPVALAVAAALLVLALAWSVVHHVRLAAAAGSAAVVLLGSGGLVGTGAGLAAQRLLLTVLGAGLAAGTVAVLWRLDDRDRDDATAGDAS